MSDFNSHVQSKLPTWIFALLFLSSNKSALSTILTAVTHFGVQNDDSQKIMT